MSTAQTLMLVGQTVFAAGLFYSCFCRMARTNASTIREIRWTIWLESVAAALLLGAPVMPILIPEFQGEGFFQWKAWETPAWIYILLLIAATLMQWVTAKFWRNAPPRDFQMRGFLP